MESCCQTPDACMNAVIHSLECLFVLSGRNERRKLRVGKNACAIVPQQVAPRRYSVSPAKEGFY